MPEQTLYAQKSKKAVKEISLKCDPKKPMKVRMFDSDNETVGFLGKRFEEMESSRPDQDWEVRQRQFESLALWNDDNTAETNLPIEFATIRNKMADALVQKQNISFVPTEKDDVYKVDLINEIWDFVWAEADTDKEIFDLYLMAYIFGTAFWFEGMHKETRTQFIPKINDDGEVVGTPKTTTLSWIKGWALDIRDVYVDPVHDLELATDCFILERGVDRETLEGMKEDPNFDADAIDMALLSHGGSIDRDKKPFRTEEELKEGDDVTQNKFTLYHYYNKLKGIYIVSVDNTTVIRHGVTPFSHGELPISVLVDNKNPRQLYGRGECELLESSKYERNEIRNQIIDMVRRAADTKVLMGQNMSLEDKGFIDDVTQVLSYDGSKGDIDFLQTPTQNQGLFNVEELLRNDATWITGIDNNSLVGQQTRTAFEARLQEVTKLKGISVSLKLADFFFTRVARQRLANIQFWLPATTGKKIIGEGKNRKISISDKRKVPIMALGKNNEVIETGVRFEDQKGAVEVLEVKPDMIKNNLDVKVVTPSTTSILKELNRQELKDVLDMVMQIAQIDPKILEEFDAKKHLNEMISSIDKNPDDFFKQEDETVEKQNIRQELLKDLPLPPKTATQPKRLQINQLSTLQQPVGQPTT